MKLLPDQAILTALFDYDRTTGDLRWREATPAQNAQNRHRIKNKKSGLPKGVVLTRDGKYQVSVRKGNYIGCYDTVEEAGRVYAEKAKELFGEYARTA